MNDSTSTGATEAGWNAFGEKRFEDAAALLEKATRLYPDCGIAQFRLAFAYRMLSRHDEALAHFILAAQLEPQDAGYWYQIGKQTALSGDLMGALPYFAESIDRDPLRIIAYHDAGACAGRLGYFELAVLLYTTCGVLCDLALASGFQHEVSLVQYRAAEDTLRRLLGDKYQAAKNDALARLDIEDVDKNRYRISQDKLQEFARELATALRSISGNVKTT